MAQPRVTKQWLQKQFQSSGIQIEPAALIRLIGVVEEVDDPEQFLHELLDEIETSKWPENDYSLHSFLILASDQQTSTNLFVQILMNVKLLRPF